MRDVLLTDAALWGALIMAAALIIIRRRRRRSSQSRTPARAPRGEAAELAGQTMSPPGTAGVTGHGEDTREPHRAAPRPARPAPAAPPPATQMADPKTQPHRPAAQRDGQPAAQRDSQQTPTGAATPSEQIASYYDQADQPIADYLAATGWTQRPHTRPRRAAGADAGSSAEPQDGTVGS